MQMVRTSLAAEADTTSRTGSEHGVVREVALGPATVLARRKCCVVTVDELALLVVFHRRRFTVLHNRCPHLGAELDGARIFGCSLTCPRHAHRYSLVDGALLSAPHSLTRRDDRLSIYPTRVVYGWLYASITEGSAA
jgi:nitrite reductase/ring-hydroxylating ferredoxin subunit